MRLNPPKQCLLVFVATCDGICCVGAGSAGGNLSQGGSLPMYFGVAESNGRRNYMQVCSCLACLEMLT